LFDGFHDCEPEGWRWTNGNAALPHSLAGADGPVEVRVSGFGLPHYGFVDPAEEADRRLFLGFESLGENCEFGFAQRQYGAEPVSLLRWASTSLAGLEAGLASGFAGLGDAACTHLDWSGETHEYQMRDPRFFGAHTAIGIRCADAAAEAALRDRIAARLKLLRRKLLADIASDARIFVFKARDPAIGLAEFRRLHGRLRSIARAKSRIGPPTRLLCVRAADAGERPGVVRDEGGELLLGTIDRFVPIGGSYAMWRTLCIAAHEIAGRA
jgi:hypothetical protein